MQTTVMGEMIWKKVSLWEFGTGQEEVISSAGKVITGLVEWQPAAGFMTKSPAR